MSADIESEIRNFFKRHPEDWELVRFTPAREFPGKTIRYCCVSPADHAAELVERGEARRLRFYERAYFRVIRWLP